MGVTCGTCCLEDWISGLGGYYDSNDNLVTDIQKHYGPVHGHLLKDFEAFKSKTGGAIYQHKIAHIKPYFGEKEYQFIKDHTRAFDYSKETVRVPNKRSKTGYVEKKVYVFQYNGKTYNEKEIRKVGIWIEVPIHFNTLLDLLPYFPYTCSGSSDHVIISNDSVVNRDRDEMVCEFGHDSLMFDHYRKSLNQLTLYVCKEYFLKDYGNRIVTLLINKEELQKVDNIYLMRVDKPIDYMHDIKYVWSDGEIQPHWTDPKMMDEHHIALADVDVESFLKKEIAGNTLKIQYITKL